MGTPQSWSGARHGEIAGSTWDVVDPHRLDGQVGGPCWTSSMVLPGPRTRLRRAHQRRRHPPQRRRRPGNRRHPDLDCYAEARLSTRDGAPIVGDVRTPRAPRRSARLTATGMFTPCAHEVPALAWASARAYTSRWPAWAWWLPVLGMWPLLALVLWVRLGSGGVARLRDGRGTAVMVWRRNDTWRPSARLVAGGLPVLGFYVVLMVLPTVANVLGGPPWRCSRRLRGS